MDVNGQGMDGFRCDPLGRLVPEHLVSDADRMKDELARRLSDEAAAVQAALRAFKARAFAEMYSARDLLFEKYGVKAGSDRGYLQIQSFDGRIAVRIEVAERITFGPELQAAKALIDQCIAAWAEGANENIRVLIGDAFQVNKAGRIATNRVLGLRKLRMLDETGAPDQRWLRAMEAISDALIVDETATYIRFYRRDPGTNKPEQISLDFSRL